MKLLRTISVWAIILAGAIVWYGGYSAQASIPPDSYYYMKGRASFYAHRFHGRTTANGEVFNMEAMTAAHRTLPFGTILNVVNLRNGKSVQVRINDRGPYINGRILDLSLGAARQLGMVRDGVVKVLITQLR
jgi:rare lipoprotein A